MLRARWFGDPARHRKNCLTSTGMWKNRCIMVWFVTLEVCFVNVLLLTSDSLTLRTFERLEFVFPNIREYRICIV